MGNRQIKSLRLLQRQGSQQIDEILDKISQSV
jgi:hypothetical protein